VKKGNLSNALIGTFSTFAHELAHNLVEAHNSEHEVSDPSYHHPSFFLVSVNSALFLLFIDDINIVCLTFSVGISGG
jgi:hypothetical protein